MNHSGQLDALDEIFLVIQTSEITLTSWKQAKKQPEPRSVFHVEGIAAAIWETGVRLVPAPRPQAAPRSPEGSIAIIVPLVLLVTLITTLVIGLFLCKRKRRTKTIRRQPIINGGINVEIGNPSYNMYEVGHDHSEGGLLASDFTVNAEKARYIGGGPTAFKLPHTAPSIYLNSDLKGPLSTGPTNYANPVYAKLYMDGQNCRNSLASVDERRELLPKKIDIGIRETVA
nr:PREDICTED: low-density lipoprotein receptor-related protein 1B [Phalacrocorax carbo]